MSSSYWWIVWGYWRRVPAQGRSKRQQNPARQRASRLFSSQLYRNQTVIRIFSPRLSPVSGSTSQHQTAGESLLSVYSFVWNYTLLCIVVCGQIQCAHGMYSLIHVQQSCRKEASSAPHWTILGCLTRRPACLIVPACVRLARLTLKQLLNQEFTKQQGGSNSNGLIVPASCY